MNNHIVLTRYLPRANVSITVQLTSPNLYAVVVVTQTSRHFLSINRYFSYVFAI